MVIFHAIYKCTNRSPESISSPSCRLRNFQNGKQSRSEVRRGWSAPSTSFWGVWIKQRIVSTGRRDGGGWDSPSSNEGTGGDCLSFAPPTYRGRHNHVEVYTHLLHNLHLKNWNAYMFVCFFGAYDLKYALQAATKITTTLAYDHRGLSIPTQNIYFSCKFCHVPLRPTYITRGNYIPAHVKMK